MKNNLLSESKDSRCYGLIDGVARIKSVSGKKVHVDNVTKEDGPFFCDDCRTEAIRRQCSEKANHFAHKALKTSLINKGNTELHHKIRDELCDFLNKEAGEELWKVEVPIPITTDTGKVITVIPDIAGRIKPDPTGERDKGMAIAIEIQKSPYTIKYLYERLMHYESKRIYVLYIIPILKKLDNGVNFRPRLFEKFLHQSAFGRVYYYDINDEPGTLSPMHFSTALGYVEYTEFYSPEGELQGFGGHFYGYRTLKKANWGKQVQANDLKPQKANTYVGGNEKRKSPKRRMMIDKQKQWWPKNEKDVELAKAERPSYEDDYEYDDYDFEG